MKYFTLSALAITKLASTIQAETCDNYDMKCICGDNYNKYYESATDSWIANYCTRGERISRSHWSWQKTPLVWPLEVENGRLCYDLLNTNYDQAMHKSEVDPFVDQLPDFYHLNYPLTSQIGAEYNVYWNNPRAKGIPCGFNLRELALKAGKNNNDNTFVNASDDLVYIRFFELETPLVDYWPDTMFKNARIAEMKLLFRAFVRNNRDIPTYFMDDEAYSHVIKIDIRESHLQNQHLPAEFFEPFTRHY